MLALSRSKRVSKWFDEIQPNVWGFRVWSCNRPIIIITSTFTPQVRSRESVGHLKVLLIPRCCNCSTKFLSDTHRQEVLIHFAWLSWLTLVLWKSTRSQASVLFCKVADSLTASLSCLLYIAGTSRTISIVYGPRDCFGWWAWGSLVPRLSSKRGRRAWER